MRNINRRQALKIGLAGTLGMALPFSVNANTEKIALADENILNPFIRPNIIIDKPYGNLDWNNLQTREERIDLLNEMLEIDKTNEILPIKGEWDCTQFRSQIFLNFFGYKNEEEIPSKYNIKNNGKFNLPVQNVFIISNSWGGSGHEINSILVGDNPLNFYDWYFFEPQTDKEVNIGNWSMPNNTTDVDMFSFKFTGENFRFEKWLVYFKLENKIPSLAYNDPNLILTRPGPVLVAQNKPLEFSLSQNYPNPFNASTRIIYEIENPQEVSLKIYNNLGQLVKTIFDKQYQQTGKHEIYFNGNNLSSGTYLYSLEGENGIVSKKMSLVK